MQAIPNIMRVISLIRLRPFDTSTEGGRSRERYRRVALSGLATGGGRVVSVLTSLITVPLTLRYLGTERFGMWMTISSFVAMLSFADLGIGNGLLNSVADAGGRGDKLSAQRAISSAFWMLSCIGTALLIATAFAYHVVPWQSVFQVKSPEAVREAGPVLIVLVACFATSLPLGIIARIENGYQSGFVVSLWAAGSNLLSLAFVLLTIHLRGSLPVLLFGISGIPVLGTLANGVHLFAGRRPWLLPRVRLFSIRAARTLFGTGLLFFSLQITTLLAYTSDNLVIAQLMGAAQVPNYAVPARLFNMIPMILGMAISALWPAYAEAIARGDRGWVLASFRRSLFLSFGVAIPVLLVLMIFGKQILLFWVGPQITVSFGLIAAFAIRGLMSAFLIPASLLLNGLGKIKVQAAFAVVMAVANLGLSITFVKSYGVIGAIVGTDVAEAIFSLIPTYIIVNGFLRHIQAEKKKELA